VIVRAELPARLERLRRRSVGDAADGVPAHLTLLYPFVDPERLDAGVRRALADVAVRHRPFEYDLAGSARWPDTVYVRVDPEAPFARLQADLARRFPEFPLYGGEAFTYVPHVTVAEGGAVNDAATLDDPGWAALPIRARASSIELIARTENGRWRTRWRIRLGGPARSGRR
jgi:2'-5' RNA ligase